MSVYRHLDYKLFLVEQIKKNRATYGYKSKLAEAAGCQKSFISQVLNSHVHLTPEHAIGLARFWRLPQAEEQYFFELVNYGRAGTDALRSFLKRRIDHLKKENEHLGKRFQQKRLSADDEGSGFYYSSWHYSAIHIGLTIPEFRQVKAIAHRLLLPEPMIEDALARMKGFGLVEKGKSGWLPTNKSLHLPKESYLTAVNNNNWRQRALQSNLQGNADAIHYTGVYSMSREDFERLRVLTFEFIDQGRQIVVPSQEEELYCVNCDFFRV